jgi:mono/diheme cytochrome c family protein
MLKRFLLLSAAILFAFAFTPATGGMSQATPPSTNPVKSTTASRERAKVLYGRDCAMCHGDKGDGKTDLAKDMQMTPGDWTDPRTLASKSDQALFDAIRKGTSDKMPPEDVSRAKNDDVWDLVRYIRAFSKDQPTPAQTAPAQPAPEQPAPAPTN